MDRLVYAFHALFFSMFLLRLVRTTDSRAAGVVTRSAQRTRAAGWLVMLHGAGFGVAYFGLAEAFARTGGRAPQLLPGQAVLGAAIMLAATGLVAWSLLSFRSWRLSANLDVGHELMTRGPFAIVRHPIYMAVDLLLLGTVIWVPTGATLLGLGIAILGGEARSRAEEKVLLAAFGDSYRTYQQRVSRMLPGIY